VQRRIRLGCCGAALLAFAPLALASCSDPRNVVLISIDTLRRDHSTPYGYARDTTPALAELAKQAVVFDDAIAAHTSTAPSHASMLTGLYPPAHGVERNRYRLAPGVRTLGQMLGDAGYRTAAFVSGYTLNREHTGLDRGFERYVDHEGIQRTAPATLRLALDWLEAEAGRGAPFFLFLHLYDPHYSYNAAEPFASRFLEPGTRFRYPLLADRERLRRGEARPGEVDEYIRRYDGEIAYADHAVGILRNVLELLGCWDQSIVIVVSDHGETLDERAWVLDHGSRVTEEQIRIPLLLRLPGGRYGGQRVETPVHHVDLVPTVLELLGEPVPEGLHGRSLLPLLDGLTPREPDRTLLSYARPMPERIDELPSFSRKGLVVSLRAPPLKLVAYPNEGGALYQLFDLEADPAERRDLAASRPQLVEALAARLEDLERQVGEPGAKAVPALPPDAEERLRALGYAP